MMEGLPSTTMIETRHFYWLRVCARGLDEEQVGVTTYLQGVLIGCGG